LERHSLLRCSSKKARVSTFEIAINLTTPLLDGDFELTKGVIISLLLPRKNVVTSKFVQELQATSFKLQAKAFVIKKDFKCWGNQGGSLTKVQRLKEVFVESSNSLTLALETNAALTEKVRRVELDRNELACERSSWRNRCLILD